MRRRVKQRTRKQTAIRRCIFLIAVVLLMSALRIYGILPIQVIWRMADRADVEHPIVVERFYDNTLPVTRFAVHHLVEGDNSVMLGVVGFQIFMGWYDRAYATVETWDENGLYAGIYQHTQDEESVMYLYGRIDKPEIERLSLRIKELSMSDNTEMVRTVEIPMEGIMEKNKKRYILTKLQLPEENVYPQEFLLTGWDISGQAVVTTEAKLWSWFS